MSWINEEYQKLDRSPHALRRFGFTVGTAILALGGFFLWRNNQGCAWLLIGLGAVLSVAAGFAPGLLKWVHGPWMMLALAMGWCMTRVLLTIVFFLVVTPIGLLQKLCGKRSLELGFRTGVASYWYKRTTSAPREEYERQF